MFKKSKQSKLGYERFRRGLRRVLRMEVMEDRLLMASDLDDQISEATSLGAITSTEKSLDGVIDVYEDVDMIRFTVTANQVVDIDIDTPANGPGGLGSYIRLFNGSGVQLASNDDAMAPGENVVGFDSYLRYTFPTAGSYYVGISNNTNIFYNAVTGNGDTTGGSNATGSFKITIVGLPNDTDDEISEANLLGAVSSTAKIFSDSIAQDVDVDMVRFSVTKGQTVDFDIDTATNGAGGLGSYIRLFNSSGQQLDFNNDGAAPGETIGFDSYLRYTFATAGNYYLGISNFNNASYNAVSGAGDTAGGQYSIGDYQLTVQLVTPPPNDTDDEISEATSLGTITTSSISANASIDPDVDVDMYRFAVSRGQVVDFDIDTTLNGPGGLGSYLRLFNASGTQLDFNNDGNAPGENVVGFDSYLRYTFATAGTYYLAVSNFNNIQYDPTTGAGDTAGGQHTTGDYRLTVQGLPVDPDDTLTQASALGAITTTPTSVSLSISPDIDVDMVRFTVTAGQVIDFDIDTQLNGVGGLDSLLRIFNSQGNQLAVSNDALAPGENTIGFDAYLRYTFPTAGTYYAGISNANNALYNAVTGDNDNAGGFNTIGAFQLIVQEVVSAPNDPDDTLTSASNIGAITTTPITSDASISPDVDVDMYRFTVSAGMVVDFDIDTQLNGSGGLGSYLRLFNAQGVQLAFNDDGNAPGENVIGFDAYLRYTFENAGTYYLGVSNFNNITYSAVSGDGDTEGGLHTIGNYQLIVQALPVDPDDALTEASSLGNISATTTNVKGSIDPDIDVDMYRFTASAGDTIDFDIDTPLNGPGGLGSFIRLFNASGTEIAFNNDATAPGEGTIGFDSYLRYTFANSGTYYLGISNANNRLYNAVSGDADAAGGQYSIGSYDLNVMLIVTPPNDNDDTFAESTQLGSINTTPSIVDSSINPDVDVDMYRFTVSAGEVVDFDIDTALNGNGGLGSYLRLFNALGAELASNNDGMAPGENNVGFDSYLRYTFTTAGTYYLGVSNFNNIVYNPETGTGDVPGGQSTTGAYQLIVQALPVDPDDTLTDANSLGSITTTPKTVNGSINPDIDVDMIRFNATAGQTIDFDIDTPLNGTGGLGSYIRLFNAAGVQLDFNNDAAAPGESVTGFDAYLRYTFATTGSYYLGISNVNNTLYDPVTGSGDTAGGMDSIGEYQLIVQAIVAPPNDTDDQLSEATILGSITTTPVVVSAAIDPDVDVDMVRFTVAAGAVVDFDIDTPLNGTGGLGSFIRLFNVQGDEIASNNDGAAPGENTVGFDAYLRYAFATAGTYYIGVSNINNTSYDSVTGDSDVSGGSNATGSYQLTIQALPVDLDDEISEATQVGSLTTTATTLDATIGTDIDVDMFGFNVTAGQTIDFDIDTVLNGAGGLGSYIRLFNSQGDQLDFNNDAAAPGEARVGFDAYLRYTFPTGGTYYLGVSNLNNPLYNPVDGTGDAAGGQDSIGNYQITFQAVVLSPNDPDDALSEAKPLGALSTTPTTVQSSIAVDTDVNMVRFSVTAGQVVDFDIDTPLNGSGGLGSYIRLFDSSGAELALNDDGMAPGENIVGFDAYLRYTFASAGTYYLGVSNFNNTIYDPVSGNGDSAGGLSTIGSYQLSMQVLPIDLDDSTAEATSLGNITTPTTINDLIDTDIDVDFLKFTVTANQTLDFDIDTTTNGPGGLGSYLRIFNSQGTEINFNDDAAAPGEAVLGFDSYLRHTFSAAGTYFVAVSNYNNTQFDPISGNQDTAGGLHSIGSYQLVIQNIDISPTDSDDTIAEATQLGDITATPKIISASILPDIDVNMVGFAVTAGEVVDFDIDTSLNGSGGLGSFIRLFDSSGTMLGFNNDAAAPGENRIGFDSYLRYTFATAGTYYLGVSNVNNTAYDPLTGNGDVSGGSNSTGAYQLILQQIPEDLDDSMTEATSLGVLSNTPTAIDNTITTDIDVDLFKFDVVAGDIVDFDIDTVLNGAGGLGSFLRLFNSLGTQIALNNDAAAPNEPTVGFDAYIRHTFASSGTYFIGVSNLRNTQYDASSGGLDQAGGFDTVGDYRLNVQLISSAASSLAVQIQPKGISEIQGTATGTVTRSTADMAQPLLVTLTNSHPEDATIPATVTIPANEASANFQITAIHNTQHATVRVSITATSSGFTEGVGSILIYDQDGKWHNAVLDVDVTGEGKVTPLDALIIINYLNQNGSTPIPEGNPPPYMDVSLDNLITPLDALVVINYLNLNAGGEGEFAGLDEDALSPERVDLALGAFLLSQ